VPWMTITPDTDGAPNGNGNGTVVASVSANLDPAPRIGTATIAGQTLTVLQDGVSTPACSYAITPTVADFSAAGGTGTASLVTPAPCSWWTEVPFAGSGFASCRRREGRAARHSATRSRATRVSSHGPARSSCTATPATRDWC
jgi:hypothetical protein